MNFNYISCCSFHNFHQYVSIFSINVSFFVFLQREKQQQIEKREYKQEWPKMAKMAKNYTNFAKSP